MNKAYKVIWSKVKGCYVVVSELAKERGKNNSRGKHALLAGIVMATLLGSALFPADMVYAADGAAHYVNVAVNTGKTIEAEQVRQRIQKGISLSAGKRIQIGTNRIKSRSARNPPR